MNGWGSIADITWLLSRMGRALLLLVGIRVCTAAFPALLFDPQWWLKMARELINISPVLLTGTTVLMVTSRIVNAGSLDAGRVYWKERRLMRWMATVYALLIGIQLVATVLFDQAVYRRQGEELRVVQREMKIIRDSAGGGMREPRIQQLQKMENVLLTQKQYRNKRQLSLGIEALRVCGSAAVIIWLLLVAFRLPPW